MNYLFSGKLYGTLREVCTANEIFERLSELSTGNLIFSFLFYQAALDKARSEINQRREAYRQKFLEAEKQKEEAQAAEAAKERERSPSPSKSRKSASTAKGGRKTPSKGKKK